MLIPIRCPTCGKPVSAKWDEFKTRVENTEDPKQVLDSLGIERYCCRMVFLTHVDLLGEVSKFRF